MPHNRKAQETIPVLARDGRTTLGYCRVAKFGREPGQPLKEIVISNTREETIALVFVYRLHSRVRCGTLELEAKFVDSKDAVALARAALESGTDPEGRLTAIQEEAEWLDAQRKTGEERIP